MIPLKKCVDSQYLIKLMVTNVTFTMFEKPCMPLNLLCVYFQVFPPFVLCSPKATCASQMLDQEGLSIWSRCVIEPECESSKNEDSRTQAHLLRHAIAEGNTTLELIDNPKISKEKVKSDANNASEKPAKAFAPMDNVEKSPLEEHDLNVAPLFLPEESIGKGAEESIGKDVDGDVVME